MKVIEQGNNLCSYVKILDAFGKNDLIITKREIKLLTLLDLLKI